MDGLTCVCGALEGAADPSMAVLQKGRFAAQPIQPLRAPVAGGR
jgi:hypothetical protein